jgi:hypothetical protein
MKAKITYYSVCKNLLIGLGLLLCAAQLNAQTFEAEDYTESAYSGTNTSEHFSGGVAVTLRASYGAYVGYAVTVAAAGTYDIAIDYATMNTRRVFIKVDEQTPTVVEFDDYTGGWDGSDGTDEEGETVAGIKTKTAQIYLNAGENFIQIGAFDTANQTDSPNIDKFTISPSSLSIAEPANQPAPLVLEAENATTIVGNKQALTCYSGGQGVLSMNAGSEGRLVFENVNVTEAGTYDLTVFYTSAEGRKLYSKVNAQGKAVIDCSSTTDYWECPAEDQEPVNAPVVLKKTSQIYLKQGNNTLVVGAHGGWAPNVDKIELQKSFLEITEPEPEPVAAIFDFTDNVEAFPNDFTEQRPTDSKNLFRLVDNNEFTNYIVPDVSQTQVSVKLASPIVLSGYAIACSYENPVSLDDWVVEYSTDGNTWNETASAVETVNANYKKVRTGYSPNDETVVSAQYFRLTATGNTKVEIGEWQLFGLPYVSDEQNFPNDNLTEAISWENIQSYAVANEDGFDRGGSWNEVYENVFDKSAKTKYTVVGNKTFWIELELPDPAALESYALSVHYTTEYSSRNPSKWSLEGYSATINDWVILDKREEIKFPEYGSTLAFSIPEPDLCYMYRLSVEDNCGAGDVHLCQWQMFDKKLWIDEFDPEETATKEVLNKKTSLPVYSGTGKIILHAGENKALPYQVYNTVGQMITKGVCRPGINEIPVSQGIYIVRASGSAAKIIVK